MRTIISGRVTASDIEDAVLMAGITATSFVVNGEGPQPPAECGLPVDVHPICKMRDAEGAVLARDYTLCQNADALIVKGRNDHLVELARKYDLPVYEV